MVGSLSIVQHVIGKDFRIFQVICRLTENSVLMDAIGEHVIVCPTVGCYTSVFLNILNIKELIVMVFIVEVGTDNLFFSPSFIVYYKKSSELQKKLNFISPTYSRKTTD